jgi:hypothetical protein
MGLRESMQWIGRGPSSVGEAILYCVVKYFSIKVLIVCRGWRGCKWRLVPINCSMWSGTLWIRFVESIRAVRTNCLSVNKSHNRMFVNQLWFCLRESERPFMMGVHLPSVGELWRKSRSKSTREEELAIVTFLCVEAAAAVVVRFIAYRSENLKRKFLRGHNETLPDLITSTTPNIIFTQNFHWYDYYYKKIIPFLSLSLLKRIVRNGLFVLKVFTVLEKMKGHRRWSAIVFVSENRVQQKRSQATKNFSIEITTHESIHWKKTFILFYHTLGYYFLFELELRRVRISASQRFPDGSHSCEKFLSYCSYCFTPLEYSQFSIHTCWYEWFLVSVWVLWSTKKSQTGSVRGTLFNLLKKYIFPTQLLLFFL